jgi:hypothetical protein
MDSASPPRRPTTSAFATQVTSRRPGPYNPRTPALTAEQARMMVQEEFESDSHQPSPMVARLGPTPRIHLPSQGTSSTSPTFHTAPEDVDFASIETPTKRRRLDSKGKSREVPHDFDHEMHPFSSPTRTSDMPLLNRMTRAATEPQLRPGTAGNQQDNALLTENEILRKLLGEKEKENSSLRRQIKLMKKLNKTRINDTHMVRFMCACGDIPSSYCRVTLAPVARPPRLPQQLNSTFNRIHQHPMLRNETMYPMQDWIHPHQFPQP